MTPISLTGLDDGLMTNKKPMLLPDKAWAKLYNARVWRERILKREGLKVLGRLRRVLVAQSLGNTPAGPPNTVTFTNIFTTITITGEPDAEIEPGSLVITVAAPDTATFTDDGTGNFTVTGAGVSAGSYVNYATGRVVLQFSALTGGAAITANINYFPSLPVMGIQERELPPINDEQTIWFDEKYAYIRSGSNFQEFIPGTTWAGTDSDFFWGFNYRGAAPQDKLFFVTNFVNNSNNPIRYTDGITWTTFAPLITATDTLFQARILIAYYGRLVALNTWEGTTAGSYAGAVNISNRCRFSAYAASPIGVNAWRTDVFGQGGVIDAPTNEAITGATFIKNTLVVDFETTTWQLRYVGEYGLPFVWERISADFGSESTFSGVLFDNYRLAIGDTAITAANGIEVNRIDLDIPDLVYQFKNANNGVKRIFGIRDFQRELVFWNWPDSQTEAEPGVPITFPNRVLVYNYRNQTFAIFRDSITSFGYYQLNDNITWDSTDIFWDDEDVTWDDFDTQSKFPSIVSGNQQGFVHLYGYTTPDESSLTIEAIDLTVTPIVITSTNHNCETDEIIYIQNMLFLSSSFIPATTDLNDKIYRVTVITENTFSISKWNFTTKQYENNFSFTPDPADNPLYIGNGTITLFPKLDLTTKDFNIFASKGLSTKLSSIDFLMQATTSAAMSVNIFMNSSPAVKGNFSVGQTTVPTNLTTGYYPPASDYAWFKFWCTAYGQYFNINLTYDDSLMNTLSTHQQSWTLYGINAYVRQGGRLIPN